MHHAKIMLYPVDTSFPIRYTIPMKSVEIFAGGGGLALGVAAAGFSHSSLIEWDVDSAKTLYHNYRRSFFTVIGYWANSMQRFADSVAAANAEDAEKIILDRHQGVSICGVIRGRHKCVDVYATVQNSDYGRKP
jgi:site-specific DNA-cytosine methylase